MSIASLDALILHGLKALRESLQNDKDLTGENCSVGIVAVDRSFEVLEGDALAVYLAQLGPTNDDSSTQKTEADAMET